MSVLGLRASAQEIRFALLEQSENGKIAFLNQDGENRLRYPTSTDRIEEKLYWVKSEIDRVLRINANIKRFV